MCGSSYFVQIKYFCVYMSVFHTVFLETGMIINTHVHIKTKRIKQKLVLLLPSLSEKEFETIFSFLNNHETELSI